MTQFVFVLGCVMCTVHTNRAILQCFVSDLNGVTENDQIKHELRIAKIRTILNIQ